MNNPILGVFYHWLGGLASGSFYVPFRGVKRWSWETSWLAAGVFSWIIAPWVFATLNTTDVLTVLKETPGKVWFFSYLFGAMWGLGGLTFGLTMRYLGMSLGMAVALGYCTVFGTLIPPLFMGEFVTKLIDPINGRWVLAGLVVCVVGIIVTALAGRAKESEMTEAQKRDTVKEFNFKKGILVATFSGVMSACFAFGLTAGDWMRATTLNVDMVNDAATHGKKATRTAEPTGAEADEFCKSLAGAGLFGSGKDGSLTEVMGMLEEPFTVRSKIAALKGQSAMTADESKYLAALESQLPAAEQKAITTHDALKALAHPLATRITAYAAQLPLIATETKIFDIVDNLSPLSSKETALNVAASGADLPAIHAKHSLWTGLPILIVVLLGGFTTNFIWCVLLNIKNRTGYQYFSSKPGKNSPTSDPAAGGESGPAHTSAAFDGRKDPTRVPLVGNYLFAGLAGVTWYFQFFFYSMGETQMGDYKFSSWTLHMASIIIFSSIWGLALREWKGASAKSKGLLFAGLCILILSTLVVGYGNYIGAAPSGH
jgi:hypothetical protein